jgi:hypothetical protein
VPDHKTIADFRKDNGKAIRQVCARFVDLCRQMGPLATASVGNDRAQRASMAKQAKTVLQAEELAAVANRGYFSSPQILECAEAGITVTLPKPLTSGAKSQDL